MSDELLRKLQFLEEDYPGMPPAVQQTDLVEINQLRRQLGLPEVDSELNEVAAAVVNDVTAVETPAAVVTPKSPGDEHAEPRRTYEAYLIKKKELQPHREYALRVANATSGGGQTPVKPLATIGTGSGPLLCDECGKPILLEGGNYHGVTADVAWRENPLEGWRSWILGGMVVEIQTNGTLRIYHGYPGQSAQDCCNIASRKDAEAQESFDSSQRTGKWRPLLKFIEDEIPRLTRKEQNDLLNDILRTMFDYDPGIGINRP